MSMGQEYISDHQFELVELDRFESGEEEAPHIDPKDFYLFLLHFRWKTMKGEVMTLDAMKTSHIFNSLKMIYNHIARVYDVPPVWFQHEYPGYDNSARKHPAELLKVSLAFVYAIEKRGDLPEKYEQPYAHILKYLIGIDPGYKALVARPPLPAADAEKIEEMIKRGLIDG